MREEISQDEKKRHQKKNCKSADRPRMIWSSYTEKGNQTWFSKI
jgi:hypothetical protein